MIPFLKAEERFGSVGLTLCPGKIQANSMSGPWVRDLRIDLDAIEAWNATAVVSLVEKHEMKSLRVENLGEEVLTRHMKWYHLPIVDGATPNKAFEERWVVVGEELRSLIRSGCNVLVHCKGGIGRAGTIAARLLIELGMEPSAAIEQVRYVRRMAIENWQQELHVSNVRPIPEQQPSCSVTAVRDRSLGAILGLACGDAVGTTLEFRPRDAVPSIQDMVGGGPFNLKPGEWTDDTSMALALLDSLIWDEKLDEYDLMNRFTKWFEEGAYSSTGRCFDIGTTTRAALRRWQKSGNPVAGASSPDTAGNGSLMRLAPVAMRHWQDRERLRDVAERQSCTTHAARSAIDACVAFAEILADAISGAPRSEIFRLRASDLCEEVADAVGGSWRQLTRKNVYSSGYVVHSLNAALWCVARTNSFQEAVLLAANLGDDADTTAAITGQLAGALYGASGIPQNWLNKLAWREKIELMADELIEPTLEAYGELAATHG
jgi:ADP-ribosyl-[dinitrogen reductase] hydrolase